jgi:hypothetical protein
MPEIICPALYEQSATLIGKVADTTRANPSNKRFLKVPAPFSAPLIIQYTTAKRVVENSQKQIVFKVF